jgi:hypothetical protein
LIVGFLDMERAVGMQWSAADLNEKVVNYYRDNGLRMPPPVLTDDDLARIRQRRAELFAQLDAVPAGGTLELAFPPDEHVESTEGVGGTTNSASRPTSRPR